MKNRSMFLAPLGLGLAAASGSSMAATAGAVTAIGAAATPIAAIGAAVLLVLVGIKVLKWVRRAF